MLDGSEKRDYVRVTFELKLEIHLHGTNPGKIFYAKTRNISEGGIGAEITAETQWYDQLIPKKTNLMLDLHLPDANIYSLPCVVDWKQKIGVSPDFLLGISFIKLGEDARDKIHALIVTEFIKNYGKEDSKTLPY